jgi:hypothetical protein
MAAKDYIYLSLIGLSALVFYLHGLQTGVRRCRKILTRFFEYSEALNELPPVEPEGPSLESEQVLLRGQRAFFSKTTIRGVFGRN